MPHVPFKLHILHIIIYLWLLTSRGEVVCGQVLACDSFRIFKVARPGFLTVLQYTPVYSSWFPKKIGPSMLLLYFLLYLFEVRGWLNLPDRLHEGVPDDNTNVRPRVALCLFAQRDEVCVCQFVGGGAQMQLEHEGAGVLLRQRNVDSLFKPKTRTKDSIDCFEGFNLLNPEHFSSTFTFFSGKKHLNWCLN